jgi:hypothetical protein
MPERVDRRRAHFVPSPDRERQAVAFEFLVGLEDHVRGGIVRVGVHRIAADLISGRGEAEICTANL